MNIHQHKQKIVFFFVLIIVWLISAPNRNQFDDMHNPYTKVLFREFTNNLVTLAYHLYHDQQE